MALKDKELDFYKTIESIKNYLYEILSDCPSPFYSSIHSAIEELTDVECWFKRNKLEEETVIFFASILTKENLMSYISGKLDWLVKYK